jgi:hypothetical protein
MYRAAAGLSVGGLAGFVTASMMMGAFPQIEQPGMKVSIGLGVASLASMNASVGALGVARYRHTGKIRPLLLSTLVSSGMVLGQFALAMGVAWSQDSESLDEEAEDNDIADAVAGTLLAGSATAIPVASGLLFKATKESIKAIKNRKSKSSGVSASR